MARGLRVVLATDETIADMTMADAIVKQAKRIAAENPSGVLFISEHALPGNTVEVRIRCLPHSQAMTHGLIQAACDVLYPDPPAED